MQSRELKSVIKIEGGNMDELPLMQRRELKSTLTII